MTNTATHIASGSGPHHLMLGAVAVSRLLGAGETGGELSLVELSGLPASGPHAHIDPWRESFYVLEGELTFQVEQGGAVRELVARAGDAVSIPPGVGHAFSVTSAERARYLVLGTPAGIDAFFANAGQPLERPELPDEPPPVDRERLLAAFDKHGMDRSYSFPASVS